MVRAVLFIPQERCQNVYEALQERRSGSVAAIHHRKVDSVRSERFRVAERWLHWFQSEGSAYCALKVFAVDHVGLRKFPFRGDHGYADHVLHNVHTTFIAGLRWSIPWNKHVQLKIVSDRSGDDDFVRALKTLPDWLPGEMDRRRAEQDRRRAATPARRVFARPVATVSVDREVLLCASNAREAVYGLEQETEFVQLTDLLLGVVWDAVLARMSPERSPRSGRIHLTRQFVEDADPSVVLKWRTRLPIANRISVSLYPDEFNNAYPAVAPRARLGQMEWMFDEQLIQTKRERGAANESLLEQYGALRPKDQDEPLEEGPAGIATTEGGRPSHGPAYERPRLARPGPWERSTAFDPTGRTP